MSVRRRRKNSLGWDSGAGISATLPVEAREGSDPTGSANALERTAKLSAQGATDAEMQRLYRSAISRWETEGGRAAAALGFKRTREIRTTTKQGVPHPGVEHVERVDAGYSLEEHVEGESRHLDAPLLRLELAKEMEKLRRAQPWRARGHNAKTLVKYPDLRIVLIVLKRRARIEEHATTGQISIHTLDGHVRLKLTNQVVDLPAGCLLGLERLRPHDLEALEDSAVLLTVSSTRAGEGHMRLLESAISSAACRPLHHEEKGTSHKAASGCRRFGRQYSCEGERQ